VKPWIVKLSVICAVLFAVIRKRHVSGEQHVVPIQMFVEMNVVPAGKNVSITLSVAREEKDVAIPVVRIQKRA